MVDTFKVGIGFAVLIVLIGAVNAFLNEPTSEPFDCKQLGKIISYDKSNTLYCAFLTNLGVFEIHLTRLTIPSNWELYTKINSTELEVCRVNTWTSERDQYRINIIGGSK